MGALTTYAFYVYRSYSLSEDVDPSNSDVSYRYNATAKTFDRDVDFTERYTGIVRLRRELVEQARGNVLEVAVGTGRNSEFYDPDRIKSLTFLDQSQEMVEVAKAKWQEMYSKSIQGRFITRSALGPLPKVPRLAGDEPQDEGYDTIISTMSLCSTPLPALFLRNLATGLSHNDRKKESAPAQLAKRTSSSIDSPQPSRILLLEHGRSYYSWINKLLDGTAPAHALKHGCWWNRDIGQIAEDSGLIIISMRRKHFGTTWWLELGLPEDAQGHQRQQWLDNTQLEIRKRQAELEQSQGEGEKEMKERDRLRRKDEELDRWRKEQRQQIKQGKH